MLIAGIALLLAFLIPYGAGSQPVIYEAYAIRFGTLPQFRVAGLVAGADQSRRMDIPVMVWLLKGSNGRRVLVDSGFHRPEVRGPVEGPELPLAGGRRRCCRRQAGRDHGRHHHARALGPRRRSRPVPQATVWIQRDEYAYYTGAAWHARNTHGGVDEEDMKALLAINLQGRLRFVEGDDQEPVPASAATPAAGTRGHRSIVGVQTADRHSGVHVRQRLPVRKPREVGADRADARRRRNLKAQERIRSLAGDPSRIVPGHDPAVFERYQRVAEGWYGFDERPLPTLVAELRQLQAVRAGSARCVGRHRPIDVWRSRPLLRRGDFFGIIASDVLYLKVDDANRPDYERAGMKPFKPYKDRRGKTNYYAVPTAILECAPDLERWARSAIAVAKRAKS